MAVGSPAWAASRSANERLRIAAIGTNGKGWSNMEAAAQFGDIIALCDVDSNNRAKAKQVYTMAQEYVDMRKMFDELEDKIDLVLVSTPDHFHAVATAAALKRGKAVYCEKPLTRTIWEAREIRKIAKRAKVATQMGNQGTSMDSLRRVAAHLKAKTWGEVKEIHCWTNRAGGWWPQGVERPASKPVPANVDFDIWLGPSPERPYADGYHPFAWRGWWDFGTGAMGDIACHCMNLPFMAFNLKDPLAVQASTSGHNKDSFPNWSVITYEFGAIKERPEVKLTWYDGGKMPPRTLAPGTNLIDNGCLIVCEHATLYSPGEYAGTTEIVGGGEISEIDFVHSPGHMAEVVECMKGGPQPGSNIPDYSSHLTEMALVGNLAVWANGPRLEWDAKKMRVKGTEEYDAIIKPKYRKGWKL